MGIKSRENPMRIDCNALTMDSENTVTRKRWIAKLATRIGGTEGDCLGIDGEALPHCAAGRNIRDRVYRINVNGLNYTRKGTEPTHLIYCIEASLIGSYLILSLVT